MNGRPFTETHRNPPAGQLNGGKFAFIDTHRQWASSSKDNTMNTAKYTLIAIAFACLTALGGKAEAKSVRCDIFMDSQQYSGSCNQKVLKNGSFELILANDHDAQSNASLYSIEYTSIAKNNGKVIAMYNEGGEDWGILTTKGREFISDVQQVQCWSNRKVNFCIYI
jgi:hypothetical protein